MNSNLAILSMRELDTHVSRCVGYELEDLLCAAFPNTTVYAPRLTRAAHTGLKIRGRVTRPGSLGGFFDNVLASEPVDDHDALLVVIGDVRDLDVLGAMKSWRTKSRCAICRLDEFWVETMPGLRRYFPVLEQFDLVFCSEYYTAQKLSETLEGPEVIYLPPGVDALAFAPSLEPSMRPIDITNLGAIGDATHQGLLEYATDTSGFYFFETLTGPFNARSPSEHRLRYAEILKRSKYFLCYFAKMRTPELPRQLELGPRYIEGIAAGCVLLGSWESTPAFETYFGWHDAVIDLPFESADPSEILRQLDDQPDRLREISEENVRRSLGGYDHAHRWSTIVDKLGLPADFHMRERHAQLERMLETFGYARGIPSSGAAAG